MRQYSIKALMDNCRDFDVDADYVCLSESLGICLMCQRITADQLLNILDQILSEIGDKYKKPKIVGKDLVSYDAELLARHDGGNDD